MTVSRNRCQLNEQTAIHPLRRLAILVEIGNGMIGIDLDPQKFPQEIPPSKKIPSPKKIIETKTDDCGNFLSFPPSNLGQCCQNQLNSVRESLKCVLPVPGKSGFEEHSSLSNKKRLSFLVCSLNMDS